MAVKMQSKSGADVAKQFYRAARKNCPTAYRKKLCETLKVALLDFTDANPDANMEALTVHFGRPEDFANAFINEMTAEEKQQMLKRAKVGKWCALAVTATFILAIIAVAIGIILEDQKSEVYYYREDVISSADESVLIIEEN